MTKRLLSTLAFNPMVESVSRKFARRKDTCVARNVVVGGDAYNTKTIPGYTYMGSMTKQVNINGFGPVEKHIMFFRRPMKAHTLTSAQMTNHGNFSAVAAWVPIRKTNLQVISSDVQMYKAAIADFSKTIKGVSASGYERFDGWLFAIGMAYKKAGETLPETAFSWDA